MSVSLSLEASACYHLRHATPSYPSRFLLSGVVLPSPAVMQVIRKEPNQIREGISPQFEEQLIAVATDLGE